MTSKIVKFFKGIGKFYQILAVLFLNILILFVLINFAASIYLKNKNKHLRVENPISEKYGQDPLTVVYPDLNKEEINDLLRETWNRPYIFESWTGLTERPCSGKYVNVDKNGFRLTKNQGPWPLDRQKYFTIFLFGGSTTFGYGVPDSQTIASYLQESLSIVGLEKEVRIYNFGRGYYYSTQERILFEQLITSGFIPDIVIFIDGLNDFGFSYGDWQFSAKFKMLFEQILSKPEEHYHWKMIRNKMPIIKAINSLKKESTSIVAKEEHSLKKNGKPKSKTVIEVENIINRYIQNKKIIEAVAGSFGIKAIFIWQPVPFYKYDEKYQLFYLPPDPRGVLGYPLMARFVERYPLGDNFLWCADIQEELEEPLYVDNIHYSARMSKIFADYIVKLMVKNNLLPIHSGKHN